jgi:predicted PurR-regulated permease PerM
LLALAEGPQRALWVAGLFDVVQTIEGYVLTPLVDRRSVSLPPALTLTAQMSLALLAGGAGMVLASPLLVCVLVVVDAVRAGTPEDGA